MDGQGKNKVFVTYPHICVQRLTPGVRSSEVHQVLLNL